LGIDRFMATGSAVTNRIGNAVAVLVIARWEKAFDREKFYRYLASQGAEAAAPGEASHGPEAAGVSAREPEHTPSAQ
jgi:aerobic C4-dicarboxylate transport protein